MIYLAEYHVQNCMKDKKTEHLLGQQLLAYGLSEEYQISGIPIEDMVIRISKQKPILKFFPDISFNITHTKGLAGCVISENHVGIDAEFIRTFDIRLMKKICSPSEISYICERWLPCENDLGKTTFSAADMEQIRNDLECQERFFRIWTLKESYVKAIGKGLAFPLREITFCIKENVKCKETISGSIPGWKFRQFRFRSKYIISVCEEITHGRRNL